MFIVDKQARVAKIIDIAIPGDARVKDKELEKIEKYQNRKDAEAEESDGCTNCDRSIRSCIRHV